jgi:hypothetical protein
MADRKIITSNPCPPIPSREADWCAWFDGDEESGPWGWGSTKLQSINGLIDNCEIDDLIHWFGIKTREVDTMRGPEYGHWIAFTGSDSVEASWEDQAVADLVFKLITHGEDE